MFGADFFTANRHKLLQATKAGLIVLGANGRLQSIADETYPFIQNSNFWYFSGLDEPDLVLVITPSETFVILPYQPKHKAQWEGELHADLLQKTSGIATFLTEKDGWHKLKQLLKSNKHVHSVMPPKLFIRQLGFYSNPARVRLIKKLKKIQPELVVGDIANICAELRMKKQPAEIAAIKQAVEITKHGLQAASEASAAHEYELEALLTYEYRRRGASGHGFEPIVAAGRQAATIHYKNNDQPIYADECVLIDTGAKMNHYQADITRVLASKSGMSDRQKAVYAAVLAVHDYALSIVKPGLTHRAYELQVRQQMAHQLYALKLIKDVADKKAINHYSPHSTSHHLGLDTHDATTGGEAVLVPGMVLTVEPGIYIPEEHIGIRLEDDVLLTEGGLENLTSHVLPPAKLLQ